MMSQVKTGVIYLMHLERIVKSLTNAIVIGALSSGCSSLPSIPSSIPLEERTQDQMNEIISHLDRDYPTIMRYGPLSTGWSNMTRASEEDLTQYVPVSFKLPNNTLSSGLYKNGESSKPLIIGTFGFLADKMSQPAHNFMQVTCAPQLSGYNILILDHPTSAPFYCANESFGWGGIEEGYILIEVAKRMKVEHEQSSIHLVGISMGGMGVIHAAYQGEGIINSALVFSPVTDYADVPGNAVRLLEPNGLFGSRGSFDLLNRVGLEMLIVGFNDCVDNYIKNNETDSAIQRIESPVFDSALLDTERYVNKKFVATILRPYINKKTFPDRLPRNVSEYVSMCDATRLAQDIEVPLYLIHAHDDPAVSDAHFYRFMLAAKGNKFIRGTIFDDGGHWGFSAAYGREWVASIIKCYAEFWSDKEFKVDPKCF